MAKVRLTKKEMALVEPYAPTLVAALSDWLRPAGREGNAVFGKIYARVTGQEYTAHDACGQCELTLARAVAEWWQETKNVEQNAKK